MAGRGIDAPAVLLQRWWPAESSPGLARFRRFGGEDDGHGTGPPTGFGGIVRDRTHRRPASDAVHDRTVEPLRKAGRVAGAHATLHWRKELLVEGLTELGVELDAPLRLGCVDGSQQVAPRPLAGSAG